ncbi:hypothetical protein J6590_036758 [Homalodisca vitripennis]|nr:hypothetical protein J6590_036758 [Homalodisca vitripennis]
MLSLERVVQSSSPLLPESRLRLKSKIFDPHRSRQEAAPIFNLAQPEYPSDRLRKQREGRSCLGRGPLCSHSLSPGDVIQLCTKALPPLICRNRGLTLPGTAAVYGQGHVACFTVDYRSHEAVGWSVWAEMMTTIISGTSCLKTIIKKNYTIIPTLLREVFVADVFSARSIRSHLPTRVPA